MYASRCDSVPSSSLISIASDSLLLKKLLNLKTNPVDWDLKSCASGTVGLQFLGLSQERDRGGSLDSLLRNTRLILLMGDFSSAFTGARIALFGGEIVAELGDGIVVTGTEPDAGDTGLGTVAEAGLRSQSTLEGCPPSNISCGVPTKKK
jgi:hypothetical protein